PSRGGRRGVLGGRVRPIPVATNPMAAATAAAPTAARVSRPRLIRGSRPPRDAASRRDLPGEVALGERPGILAALRADDPAVEVVGLDVDPAEQPRLTGLVGRVVI